MMKQKLKYGMPLKKIDENVLRVVVKGREETYIINKGLIVDYDANGKVVGIEILNIKNKFKLEDLTGLKLEMPTVVKAEA